MAIVFGNYLDKKPVDRAVLKWLLLLPDDFYVFVELEGGDFQVDFLVIKPTGIFNIEAKRWHVRRAHLDADWELIDGKKMTNPIIQAREQSNRVADYLLLQRDRFLPRDKADTFLDKRGDFKIFPMVAVSHPKPPQSVPTHPYYKVCVHAEAARRHLHRFEWEPDTPTTHRSLSLAKSEIRALAELWMLERVNPETLAPITSISAPAVKATTQDRSVAPVTGDASSSITVTDSPYQYTYTVTGDDFYGRNRELELIKRALIAEPPRPIAVQGLQRTGKSSLALESVRRHVEANQSCVTLRFDFRRLWQEGLKQSEDITKELLTQLAGDWGTSDADTAGALTERVLEGYRKLQDSTDIIDQRRLFTQALRDYKRKKQVVLFLDECQEIAEALGDPKHNTFFSFMESLCKDAGLGLRVIIACRPAFFELPAIRQINLGRLFEIITLGSLEEPAAIPIIERGTHLLTFEPASVSRILFLTGRHPFWLQFLCHRIFERWIFDRVSSITPDFINKMFAELVKDPGCRPQFYLLYQEVEKDATAFSLLQQIAEAIPREGGSALLSDLLGPWQDKAVLRTALKPLVDNQILAIENVPEAPAVRFRVEALRHWMRPNLITL